MTPTDQPNEQHEAEEQRKVRRLKSAKWALWNCILDLQPEFQKDLHNLHAMTAMAHWLIGEPYGDLTKGKGILLSGPVGTGKTVLMNALSRATAMGGGEAFTLINAIRMVKEFNRADDGSKDRTKMGGDHVILRYAELPRLTIDDVLKEELGKHYGRTSNVIDEVIQLRYERWRRGECITHITTNGGPEDLAKVYEERTLSRILEMTGEVRLDGPDRRAIAAPPVTMAIMPELFSDVQPRHEPTDEEIQRDRAQCQVVIDRIKNSLSVAVKPISDMREFSNAQKAELDAFSKGLRDYTDHGLDHLHAKYLADEYPSAVKPYLVAIEEEQDVRLEAKRKEETTTKTDAQVAA